MVLRNIARHPFRAAASVFGISFAVAILMVGVLAVVAIPRFTGVASFNAMGFTDRAMASLRYAQKQAIAKRRNVCVNVNAAGTTVTFTYANAAGSAAACGRTPLNTCSVRAVGAPSASASVNATCTCSRMRTE
jgi:MSHA pilin protein MshC